MKKLLAIALVLSMALFVVSALAVESQKAHVFTYEGPAHTDPDPTIPEEKKTMYVSTGGVPAYAEPDASSARLTGYGQMWEGRALTVVEQGEEWCKVLFEMAYMTKDGDIAYRREYAYIETKYLSTTRPVSMPPSDSTANDPFPVTQP